MMTSARKRLIMVFFAVAAVFVFNSAADARLSPRMKPPAPGPVYLSRADHTHLAAVAEALKAKQFSKARNEIALIDDPIAMSLGHWLYFKAEDPLVSIDAADAFLDSHRDWPAVSRIQSFVEGRLTYNTPADTVRNFFATRDPITGGGKIHLARALFAAGDEEAGEIHLRDAWINHNFNVKEERRILSKYGRRLTKEDHAARVDRLLWARQVTNARRVFSRLSSNERRKAEARAALLLRASSAPKLYGNLSRDNQMDPGVLHAAVRYYRRTGDEQYAIALSAEAPNDAAGLRNPGRWWDERQLLMRWALKEGRFADAYALAANHGLEEGGDLSEAEFNAGWIALRFLNEPSRAETHFLALASVVGTPISLSRAYYWLGRAAEANDAPGLANSYYELAAPYYYSFYGQLAAEKLGGGALQNKFGPVAVATPEDRALFSSRPTVAALRMLSDLGLDYEFMVFAYHIDDLLERPGEYVELARLANGEGAPHLTVRAGKVAIRRNAFAANVAYPTVFVPEEAKRFVSPEIILGLSRQESEFNPRAFSRAGARGMMQLIPSTAQITARKEGLRYSRSALLDDPVYNLTIGSAHLSHLLDQFDGSLVLTFAAYNAGASRAAQWIEAYGDPRKPDVDPVDWIELVPFSETRNYIQRVLENTQVYRGQLNDAPIPGRLASDIERGGPRGRIAVTETPSAHLIALSAGAGTQKLGPLPANTANRVAQFRLAQAEVRMKPDVVTKPGAQADDSQVTAPALLPKESNIVETQTPSPEQKTAQTPDDQVKAGNMAESAEPTVNPGPVILSAGSAPAKRQIEDVGAAPIKTPSPIANLPAAPRPENPIDDLIGEIIADRPAPLEDAPALAAVVIDTNPPSFMAPTLQSEPLPQEETPTLASSNYDATVGAEAFDPYSVKISDNHDETMDECLTYRHFLEQKAKKQSEAGDLNARMLSELQDGDDPCK